MMKVAPRLLLPGTASVEQKYRDRTDSIHFLHFMLSWILMQKTKRFNLLIEAQDTNKPALL